MQQPLAHLYFLIVMEHLFGKQQALPALLEMYSMITKVLSAPHATVLMLYLYIMQMHITTYTINNAAVWVTLYT